MSTHFTFYSYYKKEAVELKTITWDKESKGEQEEGDDEEEQKADNGEKEDANQSSANDLVCKLFADTLKYWKFRHVFGMWQRSCVDSCL